MLLRPAGAIAADSHAAKAAPTTTMVAVRFRFTNNRLVDRSMATCRVVLLFVVHPSSTGTRVDSVPPLHVVVIIPARFASTRLPGKPLADIDGRPMIEHVYRRASASPVVSQVIVATDDLRIATRVKDFGGTVRLTKATHQSGTDRLAEVAATLDCDVVVNVQADEPLIDPDAIAEAVAPFRTDESL